ncbi:2-oxoacid:acceptor oxidoreductase subunit alpha [Pasteuria penetrans]|uniref:2-oxoacid:acceptor oxidoreductase subunit alpha n=1 Tax=Pasteuria penetrans TaxID=86005 RepID=UPI0011F0382D|nr:2-oxoacid:acceptor oxidoreductase subunit alpha [Pasteuria penetrans]
MNILGCLRVPRGAKGDERVVINQLSWKVGGQQGEGIDSAGEILSTALSRRGYFLYAYRHFSSRIKGGHSNTKLRIGVRPVHALSDHADILVAFDQETIDFNAHELKDTGVILADSKFDNKAPEGIKAQLISVPMTEIATSVGLAQMKNMVAVGASAALMGIPLDAFSSVLHDRFGRKGSDIVDRNMQAIQRGKEFIEENRPLPDLRLAESDGKRRLYMIGNEALALGALAAGVRIMAAYPITPSSEIMEYLIRKLPDFGGTVVQTEDEISAVMMAIGANYAGVRAFTASAGPGLSLMTESIGLAGMTETPVVIVNTQRGGPSTGLPTKQEQSDLLSMLYSTHGEIPKIVMAPSTVEECFYDIVEAFNLADQYQCPVIVMSDLALSLGKQTVEPLDYDCVAIDRGKMISCNEAMAPLEPGELFPRYALTEDGISQRPLPGNPGGLHHVTGVEHDPRGRPSEQAKNRQTMMEKRMRKLAKGVPSFPHPIRVEETHEEADLLLCGFSSTYGVIQEVAERLREDGWKVHRLHVRLLHPFPANLVEAAVQKCARIMVVENNATGQLLRHIRSHVDGFANKMISVTQYDGNPFLPVELHRRVKGILDYGNL